MLMASPLVGCGSKTPASHGTDNTGGSDEGDGGSGGTPGTGGSKSTGGSSGSTGGSSGSTGGSSGDTGGSSGSTGGSSGSTGGSSGDTGGSSGEDASVAADASGGGGAAGGSTGGKVEGWYEAEAIPPNVLSGSTLTVNPPKPRVAHCGKTCPNTAAIKPGDDCCSGGGEVTWLTQGIGPIPGGLTFTNVTAPSDGMYDVTWWYHCGNNDNFGDVHCGGQTDPPTTASGCRPHQIVVNGTEMQGTYHFPCFAGSFGIIRAATTQLPLKAGMNSIKVYPKQRDASDVDALQVSPMGKGTPPLIKSNNAPGAN
jgi:hypothetical protein